MDLTNKIFRDLAKIAAWVFQFSKYEVGAYRLSDILKDKAFVIAWGRVDTNRLPTCDGAASWENERECVVRLSYNGGAQSYTFEVNNVFRIMASFGKIANVSNKEKRELCTLVKQDEKRGDLLAVVEMPEKRTNEVAKGVDTKSPHKALLGVYVDKGGYIVGTDGKLMNVCKVQGVFDEAFYGAILPLEFAKRADGKKVEIYADNSKLYAVCGEEKSDCLEGNFPRWKNVLPKLYERGRVDVPFSAIKKNLPKVESITFEGGENGLTITCEDEYSGYKSENTFMPELKTETFAVCLAIDKVKKVMPKCTRMYVLDENSPAIFVGDGVLSIIMPCEIGQKAFDFAVGYGINALDVMNEVAADALAASDAVEKKPRKRAKKLAADAQTTVKVEQETTATGNVSKAHESESVDNVQCEQENAPHGERSEQGETEQIAIIADNAALPHKLARGDVQASGHAEKYRFRTAEIEQMKQSILLHCTNDGTAWRLRLVLEGLTYSVKSSKRRKSELERNLALYEQLTNKDVPIFAYEQVQTEAPRATMEAPPPKQINKRNKLAICGRFTAKVVSCTMPNTKRAYTIKTGWSVHGESWPNVQGLPRGQTMPHGKAVCRSETAYLPRGSCSDIGNARDGQCITNKSKQ